MLLALLYHKTGNGKYANSLNTLDEHFRWIASRYPTVLPVPTAFILEEINLSPEERLESAMPTISHGKMFIKFLLTGWCGDICIRSDEGKNIYNRWRPFESFSVNNAGG